MGPDTVKSKILEMPQNAVLVQTDDFKSVLACSRAFGGVFGDHPNSRFGTGFGVSIHEIKMYVND